MSITGAHIEITPRIEKALKAIDRDLDPLERSTFGHGSFGHVCRYCRASDYLGAVVHTDECIWAAVHNA